MDKCRVISDPLNCDDSATDVPGLTCTVTDSGTDYTTSITIETGSIYTGVTDVYVMVHWGGVTNSSFSCSPIQNVVYDCDVYMWDLGLSPSAFALITDYVYVVEPVTNEPFNPNNVEGVWIEN